MDLKQLKELLEIDSPSGFTHRATAYIYDLMQSYGHKVEYTKKGAIRCQLGENPKLTIAAHTDTLGGIVKEITDEGTLRISQVGGLKLNSFEGHYARIYTLEDEIYTGTFLMDNPAIHVNRNIRTLERKLSNMHIRLDEEVSSDTEVEKLGIAVGDFVCFDVNYQETPSGYIKSRFLDNKSGCFVLFELAKYFQGKNVAVELLFTTFEEVGHGGAIGYSKSVEELLVIDMAVVGDGCMGKETHCSICAKDATGPYDFAFRKRLTLLAKKHQIPYVTDIYPYYSSDGSVALRAGHDFPVALIGPGVSASHGMERTHKKGIQACMDLCRVYVEEYFV